MVTYVLPAQPGPGRYIGAQVGPGPSRMGPGHGSMTPVPAPGMGCAAASRTPVLLTGTRRLRTRIVGG